MVFDLVTTILTLGVQLTLVGGGLLFLISLGRDFQRVFQGHA